MTDTLDEVINLSSDSSRPSSPFVNVSELFNESETYYNDKNRRPVSEDINKGSSMGLCSKSNTNLTFKTEYNRVLHALSDSDGSEEDCSEMLRSESSKRATHSIPSDRPRPIYQDRNWGELETISVIETLDPCTASLPSVIVKPTISSKHVDKTKPPKVTKEQRMEEKLKRQREKEMKKAEKLAAQELLKQMKPGNCIKYMTVNLDPALLNSTFSGALLTAIQNAECKHEVIGQAVPHMISWTRQVPGPHVKEENDVVLIWQWQFVIPAIKNHSLCSQIQDIQASFPGKSVLLIVFGLNGYFGYVKSKRKTNSASPHGKKRKVHTDVPEYPYVTRKEIEEELIELQIMFNCNHRLIESPEDLGQLIVNITKAIAETPFKLDKQRRELENLEWFAVGDSRDCVAVDKAGNGLLRLWQQQLSQFNLAGHDVAQAIAAVYPSPLSIVQAYNKCRSIKEGEELLKDIPVRRCQGPLTSSRRIGPELSRKIYAFFSSTTGDVPLSQDQ